MRYYVTVPPADELVVDIDTRADGSLRVRVGDEEVDVDACDVGGSTSIRVGTRVFDLWLEGKAPRVAFKTRQERRRATVESERHRLAQSGSAGGSAKAGRVTAPMPGRVVSVLVKEGDEVALDAPVAVVEAMKMENEMTSPVAGVVIAVHVSDGEQVDSGAVLVEIGPAEGDA